MKALNGRLTLKDRVLKLEWSRNDDDAAAGSGHGGAFNHKRTLFVSKLPVDTTRAELEARYAKYGPITKVWISFVDGVHLNKKVGLVLYFPLSLPSFLSVVFLPQPLNQESHNYNVQVKNDYAFVSYETEEIVLKAVEGEKGTPWVLRGSNVECSQARSRDKATGGQQQSQQGPWPHAAPSRGPRGGSMDHKRRGGGRGGDSRRGPGGGGRAGGGNHHYSFSDYQQYGEDHRDGRGAGRYRNGPPPPVMPLVPPPPHQPVAITRGVGSLQVLNSAPLPLPPAAAPFPPSSAGPGDRREPYAGGQKRGRSRERSYDRDMAGPSKRGRGSYPAAGPLPPPPGGSYGPPPPLRDEGGYRGGKSAYAREHASS